MIKLSFPARFLNAPPRLHLMMGCMLSISLVVLTACGEPNISEEQAQDYVSQWTHAVQPLLIEQSSGAASAKMLKTRLQQAKDAADEDEALLAELVQSVYGELDHAQLLVKSGQLTARGEAVWQIIAAVEEHAVDPQPYRLDDIAEKIALLESKREAHESFDDLKPNSEEEHFVVQLLTQFKVSELELSENSYTQITDQLFQSPQGERLRQALSKYEENMQRKVGLEVEIEQLLAQGVVHYARQMRHFRVKEIFIHPRNDDYWNEPEIRRPRPDRYKGSYTAGVLWRRAAAIAESMANPPEILKDNIRKSLHEVLTADAREVLEALPPQNPQYAGLVKERQRYKQIVADGGWDSVGAVRTLKPGTRSDVVKQLKTRLQKEHYYPQDAPLDDHYDEHLTQAIRAYQETHQMDVSGRPHALFWQSLNVSAERRLEQIELNLRRWRETNVRHEDPTYTFINVADFTVEIWRNQQREVRFPVVVGNNDLSEVVDGDEKEHANRTPTPLAAYIDRIIYNPYWNVTPRIRMVRILPEVKASLEQKYMARLDEAQKKIAAIKSDERPRALFASLGESQERMPLDEPEPEKPETAPLYSTIKSGNTKTVRFDTKAIRDLYTQITNISAASEEGAVASDANLKSKFPYLDIETGEVDVSVTDPEHIPSWYEENRYEVVFPGRTWEYVRMLPGPENALGFVKVIFPNYHDVYLHDTPAKELFARPIRAFSHGCIRMQDPLGLAEYLLRHDGTWDEHNVPEKLDTGEYLPIFLKRQVPVYLEYYTVRVDDEGRANFLADVYRYDSL